MSGALPWYVSVPFVFPLCLREPSGASLLVSGLPPVCAPEVGVEVKQEAQVHAWEFPVELDAEVTILIKRHHTIKEGKTCVMLHILPGEDVLVHHICIEWKPPILEFDFDPQLWRFLLIETLLCHWFSSVPNCGQTLNGGGGGEGS